MEQTLAWLFSILCFPFRIPIFLLDVYGNQSRVWGRVPILYPPFLSLLLC